MEEIRFEQLISILHVTYLLLFDGGVYDLLLQRCRAGRNPGPARYVGGEIYRLVAVCSSCD
jgi:hypothetical protein